MSCLADERINEQYRPLDAYIAKTVLYPIENNVWLLNTYNPQKAASTKQIQKNTTKADMLHKVTIRVFRY